MQPIGRVRQHSLQDTSYLFLISVHGSETFDGGVGFVASRVRVGNSLKSTAGACWLCTYYTCNHPFERVCVSCTPGILHRMQARAELHCDPCPHNSSSTCNNPGLGSSTKWQSARAVLLPPYPFRLTYERSFTRDGRNFDRRGVQLAQDRSCDSLSFANVLRKNTQDTTMRNCTSVPFLVSSTTHTICNNLTSESLHSHLSQAESLQKEA